MRRPAVGNGDGLTRRVRLAAERGLTQRRGIRRARRGAPRREPGILFLVTYGRSGSTLLQGILNSIPGYLIRGENRWAPYHLYQFHQVCSAARDAQYSRGHRLGPDHPWFRMDDFPLEAALSYQRTLVLETLLRPRRTTRVAGFKEIMWASGDYETFVDEGYIDYLIALFPDARFLINTRDLDATLRSGWWPNRPDGRAQLTRADRQGRDLAARLGERAFHIHYDDYVGDVEALRALFDWLGEDFHPESLDAVLRIRHSS